MRPFDAPQKSLGDIKGEVAARMLAASADVALVIDRKGVVRDLMCTADDVAALGCGDWIGQPWIETVTVESRPKIEQLLEAASAGKAEPVRWRQVNHPLDRGPDLPVRYSTIQLNSPARVIAIGQDLRPQAMQQQRLIETQASMEREYVRLRQAELRYRSLFQVSSEAVVILDAHSQRVVEANPSATTLLANGSKRVVGRNFVDLFDAESAEAALDLIASAQSMPRVDGVQVKSAHGERSFTLSASVFRQDSTVYILVRMLSLNGEGDAGDVRRKASTYQVVEAMPDAFVVIDRDRRVLTANAAFLEFCELAHFTQARNEMIDRWLGRVSVDIDVLIAHLREHGSIKRFMTVMRGEFGARADVELSGVYVSDRNAPCYGLTLRPIERPAEPASDPVHQLPRSVEQLTELVGRVPLKDLVRETTDIVERLCIEAALQLTQDNRASAAEMLGLSRQSFYVKMRRHGLGELSGDSAD